MRSRSPVANTAKAFVRGLRYRLQTVNLLLATCGVAYFVAALAASPQSNSSPVLSATEANADASADKIVAGAAAVVDDHIIPLEDVRLACLRQYRSFVVDQMLQIHVLDRECKRRGIAVSESEIDHEIEEVRKALAPETLEESLKSKRTSMEQLRQAFQRDIARSLLVADQIKASKMARCREICVRYGSGGSGTNRTEAEARALIEEIWSQLKQGKDFGDLCLRYSESEGTNGVKGDLGVLSENILAPLERPVLDTAFALRKGEISSPVKSADGFRLIQALSTLEDHPVIESSLYAEADKASRNRQVQFLVPTLIAGTLDKSKITFADDADLVPGKPLPEAAAVIDGHPIPMKDVEAVCMASFGPPMATVFVQNYVVNRECERRGIKVSDAEIDRRVAELKKNIAPMTMEEGLKQHHTTMDGLRRDFRQEIQRTKLAIEHVKPTKLVHVRVILLKFRPPGLPEGNKEVRRTDVEARALITKIQAQVNAGTSFGRLAKQYSEMDGTKDGDIVLYEGKRDVDTAIVNAALNMRKGEIGSAPGEAHEGYFLIECLSTDNDHEDAESAAYDEAEAVYREQRAQSLIQDIITDLINKSHVVYYVHS